VSAFAPVVHRERVRVTDVSPFPGTTGLPLAREMKHDVALRYVVGGAQSAVMVVVMPRRHDGRAPVAIQRQAEEYLPGRALAHASGHFRAAVNEKVTQVQAEKRRAMEEESRRAAEEGREPPPKERAAYDSAVYTAYARVEPVHLLMLSDVCPAYHTADKVWHAVKSPSVLAGGAYGWASPLFSTSRFATGTGSARLAGGVDDPGPSTIASSLRDRLSITVVHLPMVPPALDDDAAWSKVAPLPEHQAALESAELRRWLHYLAHTSLTDGGRVEMPAELRVDPVFRRSAELAEAYLRPPEVFS
jgi:hypothetical protein